jgi:hypothetical protein
VSRYGDRFESGTARVRVCAEGFAVSVREGPSIIIDRKAAQDVVHALTYALLATVPAEPPPQPRRPTPARPTKVLAARPPKQTPPRPAKREQVKTKGPAPRSPGPGRPAV